MVDWTVYVPIIIVILFAIFGYIATMRATGPDGWYNCINKAPFTPPNWTFGAVWTVLYILIAITWVRGNMYITDASTKSMLTWFFTIHMVLNLAWSLLFFGDANLLGGLVILSLMIVTLAGIIYLVRSDIWGIIFMGIYMVWLLFAFYLNWYALVHNKIVTDVYHMPPLF
jgi:benzodiazapine receptor